jgi:hypothetical protein
MGIGASIFLVAVGAILTFALEVEVAGLDLDAVGWILMLAGIVGLVLTMTIWSPRRRTVVTREPTVYSPEPTTYRAEPGTYRRVEERTELPPVDPL